ncbi:hypothetical protein SDC9_192559 [bioreactor metagenome]|uniref:Uncharacterized protein n=1 Tax=bioreactor metagenome TaxID=1076179 RepID=A0A645I2L3_9ZZZZ
MRVAIAEAIDISSGRNDIRKQDVPELAVVFGTAVIFINNLHTEATLIIAEQHRKLVNHVTVTKVCGVVRILKSIFSGTCIFTGMIKNTYTSGILNAFEDVVVITGATEIPVAIIGKETVDMGIVERCGVVFNAVRDAKHTVAATTDTHTYGGITVQT